MLDYIKGMDISTLLEVEENGGKFYDHGKEGDLLDILKAYDTNYVILKRPLFLQRELKKPA